MGGARAPACGSLSPNVPSPNLEHEVLGGLQGGGGAGVADGSAHERVVGRRQLHAGEEVADDALRVTAA